MQADTDGRRRAPLVLMALVLALSASGVLYPLAAHDERQTLVAATKGKEFGIEMYRVRQSGSGMRPNPRDEKQPTTTQTWAELLNETGQPMGTLHLTMHWTKERDAQLKLFKYFEKAKRYELTWLKDSLVATFDGDNVTIVLNGQQLYTGAITGGTSKEAATEAVNATQNLVRIAGAVEADLKAHYGPPQRDVTNCCGMEPGNITCTGGTYWGTSYAIHRSEACAGAVQDVSLRCWNAYCAGCCRYSDCNAACLDVTIGPVTISGDFYCTARVNGTACRCSLFVY